MKTQNMRDMQKLWAEQRRKAEEKAAKLAPKKSEPETETTPIPKNDEPAPKATAAPAKKSKAKKAAK